ncbi:MAG: hypothetical protein ACO3UU_13125, partial [Minisyncoccia bacterium]
MELNTDLAKALFDKVITPIKDKMKRPITNIIVNKDEDKSDLENLISSNQENANELPPPPDTIMPVDTDTETPTTNNIVNKDEEKSALETLLLSIPEKSNVLPPVPDTKKIKPIDSDISEPFKESVSATIESIQPPEPPIIKQCIAEKKDIDLANDCNTDGSAKRNSLFRYYPDKNKDCLGYAENKFKELINKCEKYSPPATSRPPTEQPAPQPSST